MSNINKILIVIVVCIFMICVASVSIVSIVTSQKNETTAPSLQEQTTESTTLPPYTASPVQTTTQNTGTATTTTTASPTTTTAQGSAYAPTGNLASDLLGTWTDSAGMSGYEFLEGGKLNWTYVDLVQFGVPFDGKTAGLYTLEGDTLTVKFSIYSATIKKSYRISINENELSMYDLEEHETATYVRGN